MRTKNHSEPMSTTQTRTPAGRRTTTFGFFAVLVVVGMVSITLDRMGGGAALAARIVTGACLLFGVVGLVLHAVRRR